MKKNPASIDEYLAAVDDDDQRTALATLRATIHAIAPRAEECISYNMPAFRVDGVVVAGFLATSSGGSYYPFSGTTLTTLADDVRSYSQTKGALHFTVRKPLPKALVRKLIATRIAESTTKTTTKKKTKAKAKAKAKAKR